MSDIIVVSNPQEVVVKPPESTVVVAAITQEIVVNPLNSSISIINSGPQGPRGVAGSGGSASGQTFVQASPSMVWTINHNMGVSPSVDLFTSGGLEMIGEVLHTSVNQVVISFNVAVAGFARLN